ncbi:MAG: hypothetical protein R3Y57_03070 [Erysipelotrichaceae bacterium]
MRKILILTHGKFAEGINHTLELFIGKKDNFYSISAYVDDQSVDDQINRFLNLLDENDELIVFTDILGGSVNQKMLTHLSRSNTHIIAGFNLTSLICISTLPENRPISKSDIDNILFETRESVVYVNEYFESTILHDDDE